MKGRSEIFCIAKLNIQNVSTIANTMWILKSKLDKTVNALKISNASVRCYRTWGDFVKQVSLNLGHLVKS